MKNNKPEATQQLHASAKSLSNQSKIKHVRNIMIITKKQDLILRRKLTLQQIQISSVSYKNKKEYLFEIDPFQALIWCIDIINQSMQALEDKWTKQ